MADFGEKLKNYTRRHLLTILIVMCVGAGIIVGFVLQVTRKRAFNHRELLYVGVPGNILLRMLKAVSLPIIVTCIVSSMGSVNLKVSKTLCWQLLVWLAITKLFCVAVGLALAVAIKPGKSIAGVQQSELKTISAANLTTADTFLDMFRNFFPPNMVGMFVQVYETRLIVPKDPSLGMEKWNIGDKGTIIHSSNLLGIILVCIVLGLVMALLREDAEPLLKLSLCIYEVTMLVTVWILWLSPPLLFMLIVGQIMEMKDVGNSLGNLGLLVATAVAGHLIFIFIMHPLLYLVIVRKNPARFYPSLVRALVTSFATSSSLATMPLAIQGLENAGVDKRVVMFIYPVATSMSKDGAACSIAVLALFVAQLSNADLTIGNYVSLWFLCAFGSVAAAGVPFSSIIVLITILASLRLPQDPIGLILACEWLIDRFSTFANVSGNCIVTAAIAKWNEKTMESSEGAFLEMK